MRPPLQWIRVMESCTICGVAVNGVGGKKGCCQEGSSSLDCGTEWRGNEKRGHTNHSLKWGGLKNFDWQEIYLVRPVKALLFCRHSPLASDRSRTIDESTLAVPLHNTRDTRLESPPRGGLVTCLPAEHCPPRNRTQTRKMSLIQSSKNRA